MLFPLFLKLAGRKVLVVGGGPVAVAKIAALREAGAKVLVVAPELVPELSELEAAGNISAARRCFESRDLAGVWLVVAAATPEVYQEVAAAAESPWQKVRTRSSDCWWWTNGGRDRGAAAFLVARV